MNNIKVKPTARRIKAFGEEYTVQEEVEEGFVVHDLHPAGHVAEVIIPRKYAKILVEA